MLKTSTVKRRVHSLFCQGCPLYDLLPTMRDDWLGPLMRRRDRMISEDIHGVAQPFLGRSPFKRCGKIFPNPSCAEVRRAWIGDQDSV
jgi:hypothetical protein